jgi:hypothetical protein
MIDVGAATAGLAGAWRLARLDRNGMRYFEATVDGFWRSFQAAVIAAPIYLILVLLRTADHPLSSDPVRATLIEAIGYVIDWTAFPLAAWYLCRAFNCSNRYFGFIVAYNWANVLQMVVFVPVAVLSAEAVLPSGLLSVIALAITGAVIYYQYFITRTALEIDVLPALAFVAVAFVLDVLLDAVETTMQMQ